MVFSPLFACPVSGKVIALPLSSPGATQHGCLPSLLGNGDKGIERVYGEEKNNLHLAD
jgi:hypothetical protein